MLKPRFFISLSLVGLLAFAAMRIADTSSAASNDTIQGVFTIINIDPPPVRGAAEFYYITPDSGAKLQVIPGASAFAQRSPTELNRRRVTASGTRGTLNGSTVFLADSIALAPISGDKFAAGATSIEAGPTGSQKWLILMCKFSDVSASTPSLQQVQGLQGVGGGYPGLDNYYRQVSYNQINLVGSQVQNWKTLPKTKAKYLGADGQMTGGDFDLLANDCMNLHDSSVNFPDFSVITVLVNSDLGCCGYGGSFNMTRDGVNKTYGFTWVPGMISGFVYLDQSFNGHELGHALGLPHSYGPGSAAPYDSQWDIMSDCSPSNQGNYGPPYWCYGPGTIAYHKDLLGWIPAANKLTLAVGTSGVQTIDMYPLGDGIPSTGYLMAQVNWPATGTANCKSSATPSNCFLTVEVRRKASNSEVIKNYDQNVPLSGVVLHRVDKNWDFQHGQAKVVDSDGNNNANDAGGVLTVGESYTDPVTSIKIEILSTVGTGGFRIRFTPPGGSPGTPTPTATATATKTATPSPTATTPATATSSPTATATATKTATATATSTATATKTATATATATSTSSPAATATATSTKTATPSPTATLPPAPTCNGVTATIFGTASGETINGTSGNDVIAGLGGDDIINGLGGNDLICGGDGADTINGGDGADTIFGENGDDIINGENNDDVISGGDGNDTIDGGPGVDWVSYAGAPNSVIVDLTAGTGFGWGNDTLTTIENVEGSNYSDTLTGAADDNMFIGRAGDDTIDGQTGLDTIIYSTTVGSTCTSPVAGDVQINLTTLTVTGAQGSDTLASIENAVGSCGNDTITGTDGPNILAGAAGNDTLTGKKGDDQLDGGPGTDFLGGGADIDTCTTGETLNNCEF